MSVRVFGVRHRLADQHGKDPRIGVMRCGLRVALIGLPCPRTAAHLAALPGCPQHGPRSDCEDCAR